MPSAVFGAGHGELGTTQPQRVAYKREFLQYLRTFLPDPAFMFSGLLPAQYTPEDTRPLVEQASGGAPAAAAMDTAAQSKSSGDWPAAGEAFLAITRDFAGTREADEAEREFTAIGAAYGQGALTDAQMQALEARVPAWETLNADAKHALMSFYNTALEEAVGGEAREAADASADQQVQQTISHLQGRALETARRFTLEEPDSLYQISSTEYWLQTAHAISPQAHTEAMAELENVLASASSPVLRLAGYGVLGVHQLRHFNKTAEALLARAEAVQAASEIALPELCARNDIAPWLKGLIGFFAAVNYMYLDRNDEALAAIDTVLPYTYPQVDKERLEFTRARVLQAMNKYSLEGASDAFWAFVEKYPNGNQTRRALRELGGIYLRAGDYDGATLIFEQILQRFPNTPEANAAADTLAYISANLAAVQPVADRRPPGQGEQLASSDPQFLQTPVRRGETRLQTSSLCGPKALQRLLELSGAPATVEELAQLAGTTTNGTSVAGLLNAAKQKGLPLTAVEATRFDDLTPPFIAYVDGDHFLLVERAENGMMTVSDNGRTSDLPEAALSARWSGVALVTAPGPELAAVPAALLDFLKGADGYGSPDPDEECDGEPCCDCPCDGPPPPPPPGDDGGGPPPGCGEFTACDPPSQAVGAPSGLPGTPKSPTAHTGVSSPGVHPVVNTFDTSLRFTETDLHLQLDGALKLNFTRTYRNSKGFNRGEFNGTSQPWQKLGKGWTHNYNTFLLTSTGTPPSYVLWVDASGSVRRFDRIGTTSDYERDADGSTATRRDKLTRNQNGTYTLVIRESITYQFSVPTSDANRYARLESILDSSGNDITLTYDNQDVATGKLTKVSGPAGDLQHLVFTYTNGLLTKVELKKTENQTTTLLQDVQFAYTSNEITTVTDNDDETVTYAYGSAQGITASRYISQVTDKRGNSTAFTWYYDTNPDDADEAYKIELTNAAGLKTVYDRNLSSDVCTITNWDGQTQLSKLVHTPVDSSTQKSRYKDFYLDATNYERWEYAYDGSGDLTQ
ncbi:MAG: hypothetical protein HYV26_14670, partial [Candidatus Hydrogenedentes bacterium]|nr:hypothetical protein [Candidatus Hydrogenedentota bacterium]